MLINYLLKIINSNKKFFIDFLILFVILFKKMQNKYFMKEFISMKKITIRLVLVGLSLCHEAKGIPVIRVSGVLDSKINGDVLASIIGQNKGLPEVLQRSFKKASCLTVRDLAGSLEAQGAPWNTASIYKIKSKCEEGIEKNYFLKEMSSKAQAKEITRLTVGSVQEEFFSTYINKPESNLNFVYPLAFIIFQDKSSTYHYFSLMPKAEGVQLIELIKDFKTNKDQPTQALICNSFYNLGKQMAKFYKKTKQGDKDGEPLKHYSLRHGDLHAGNIFVARGGKVSLIDNETVSDSFVRPTDICKDIAFLFLKSFFVIKWTFSEVLADYPYAEFFEISLPAFIGGYLSQYPRSEAIRQFRVIKNCLRTYSSADDPALGNFYENNKVLGLGLNSIIEPILNRLGKWLEENAFVHNDVDVNDPINGDRMTSLHKAVERERLVMCPLIEKGANINIKDSMGRTPLRLARDLNKEKAASLLLHRGAQ